MKHILWSAFTLTVFLIICGACVREAEPEIQEYDWVIKTEERFPDINPLLIKGDILIAGSSTVFPLVEAVATRFIDEGYSYNITIDSIGSGAGFERFCVAGDSDISNASRPIEESEIANCRTIGREPLEFRIGTDALSVVVNVQNDWVDDVTLQQLSQLFTLKLWSDVNPAWPAEPIERFIPGTDSGTFDYFVETVFGNDLSALLSAPKTQLSEDDNILVRGIRGSKYAIGFFGFAYYANNPDALKLLSVENVQANTQSINQGVYPLARPLYMYTDVSILQERSQVAAFLGFLIRYVNEEIETVGYFEASESDLMVARDHWLSALEGLF